ncbi:MAG: arsenate reductase family protein [Synechococcus sp.]
MSEPLRIYSYSRCSTCRKALLWLNEHNIAHSVTDITVDPPGRELLSDAAQQLGSRRPLFNTSGQSYRAIGSATVKQMSDEEAFAALSADGKLIKRPFVALPDGGYLVGFKPEVWADVLLG